MAASITCVPTAPASKQSACRVDVAGADVADHSTYDAAEYAAEQGNNPLTYDPQAYPIEAAFRYYLAFVIGGATRGKSYQFEVDSTGAHSFNSFIFDEPGSWSIELRKASDDSVVTSQAVTVS